MLPDEKVIRVSRRSIFVFLKKFVFMILLAAAPLVFGYLVIVNYPSILSDGIMYPVMILGASAYYLFIWLFLFFNFLDYYLDIFAITNERLINIRQDGFFARTISEQHIEKVQDVTSEVEGILRTIFKYGDIIVQTASEQEKMFFHDISHPDQIRDIIIKLADEKKRGKSGL